MVKITVLAGNPKPASRTLEAALAVAARISDSAPVVIDLAEWTDRLVQWADADVASLRDTVKASDVVIVASPTFKASFSGLLKLFLDGFTQGDWASVVAVPLMTGGSAHHSLAPEVQLKPVLTELGASMPTRSAYLVMDGSVAAQIDAWAESQVPIVRALAVAGGEKEDS